MYVKLMEKNQNAAALDSGLTLMAAGLSNNLVTRHALIQNAASSGGGRGAGGITSADIINLTKHQAEMKNNLLRQSLLGGLAKQYNLSPETIQYLEASGKLDEVIKHQNTQNLHLVEDKVDGSQAFYSVTTGKKVADVRPPQVPGEKVHEFDDQLATINKERVAAGQPPMTMEQYIQTKKPAGTTVNVAADGTVLQAPEKGYEWERDPISGKAKIFPDGKPRQYKVEGGKPADVAAEKKVEADKEAVAKGREAVNAIFKASNIGRAVRESVELADEPGATGFGAGWARSISPGGMASDEIDARLKTIDSNIAFETLKQMRDASTTGASGIGQVTEKEHDMLKSVIANLNPRQRGASLKANLIRIDVAMNLLATDDFGAKDDPKGAQVRFIQALDKGVQERMAELHNKKGGSKIKLLD